MPTFYYLSTWSVTGNPSDKIAEDFSVYHESPADFAHQERRLHGEESHSGINMDDIAEQLPAWYYQSGISPTGKNNFQRFFTPDSVNPYPAAGHNAPQL